ncbi:MAG: cupin domain-containing protein [Planctomycetota bacterium]
MATITTAAGARLTETGAIRGFLQPYGIWHENWDVADRIGPNATDEEILEEYSPEIERLKELGGFVTADIINVTADTPGLDAMLAKFDKEHTHDEDEVRFTVAGRGVFWVNPGDDGEVFAIEVTAGDLINVPAGVRHWFHLCDDRTIRCIRLFEDPGGWTPHYVEAGAHEHNAPLCWGPNYLPPAGAVKPAVEL